jgi:hypothetical protein
LAEGCVADDGPGIYVAQIVADIAGLYYEKATSCTSVTPRSGNGLKNAEISNNISIFPNPVNNLLQLSIILKEESIKIYDIVGRLNLYQGNATGDRIDVSTLEPGLYFLQIPGRHARIPFVKA